MQKDFELIPHTADVQIRVYGSDLQELFRHALIGMFQSMEPRIKNCLYKNERIICPALPNMQNIEISAPDSDQLLVKFLSQALALSDINNESYLDITFQEFLPTQLRGTLKGIDIEGLGIEIKAVTYHLLHIQKIDGYYQTDIVFDI